MLVITGTQRSGTTAVASLFAAQRHKIATQGTDEVGGYEHPDICNFYKRFLGDETFPYDDFPMPTGVDDYWHSYFASLDDKVTKFSYLLMNPAFVHIWARIRPPHYGDKFLIMVRNSAAVCASKEAHKERFDHDSLLLKQPAEVLSWNYGTSVQILRGYGYPVAFLSFYNLMEGIIGINKALEALEEPYRISEATWEKVIDTSRVHF